MSNSNWHRVAPTGVIENFLVRIVDENKPKINIDSDNYKKYREKANAQYITKIYKSYDGYINSNYKIEIKSTVLKRIENSFWWN